MSMLNSDCLIGVDFSKHRLMFSKCRSTPHTWTLPLTKFVEQPNSQGFLYKTECDLLVLHYASLFLVLSTTTSYLASRSKVSANIAIFTWSEFSRTPCATSGTLSTPLLKLWIPVFNKVCQDTIDLLVKGTAHTRMKMIGGKATTKTSATCRLFDKIS